MCVRFVVIDSLGIVEVVIVTGTADILSTQLVQLISVA